MKAVSEMVSIRDCGSQYSHTIARRVRELRVYSELTFPEKKFKRYSKVRGIIVSGGPASVYQDDAPEVDPKTFLQEYIPVLGICYGMQIGAEALGGKVEEGKIGEYGKTRIGILGDSPLFKGLRKRQTVWMSHRDSVAELPPGAELLAETEDGIPAAFRVGEKYFVQFHPEVSHTPNGKHLLKNFLYGICGFKDKWTPKNQQEQFENNISNAIGNKSVVAGASLGGDSNVAIRLVYNALGKNFKSKVKDVTVREGAKSKTARKKLKKLKAEVADGKRAYIEKNLKPFYIDTGLELGHADKWVKNLKRYIGVKPEIIDASKYFIDALRGVDEPEAKRDIIGKSFIHWFKKLVRDYRERFEFLVQGTIYPDVIESKAPRKKGKSAVIKSHHNVGALPKKLGFKKVEPLKWLFKDEIRRLGLSMGMSRDVVIREPFPGPGLGIRYVTNCREPSRSMVKNVQGIAGEFGYKSYVSPTMTVGVQGDARTYRNLVMLQGNPDWGNMRKCSEEMIKQTPANRIVYVVGDDSLSQGNLSDPFPMPICRERLDTLREADANVRDILEDHGLMSVEDYDQMPVIMFRGHERPWIGMRPLRTEDYMTTSPVPVGRRNDIGVKCLNDLYREIISLDMEGLVIDITDKPPSTVEWE